MLSQYMRKTCSSKAVAAAAAAARDTTHGTKGVPPTIISTQTRSSMSKQQAVLLSDVGISKGELQNWAANHWKEETTTSNSNNAETLYVDLYHQPISKECSAWLVGDDDGSHHHQDHQYPSSELARCFFGSIRFVPERLVLAPLMLYRQLSLKLPDDASVLQRVGSKFLLWEVASATPHQMILTWSFGTWSSVRGCTLVAFDPSLRRVYHGNCLHPKSTNNCHRLFLSVMIPLHQMYAQFLLVGMMHKLENEAAAGASRA
jgi:hypothetical protein